jgi:hypothetical protein
MSRSDLDQWLTDYIGRLQVSSVVTTAAVVIR